MQAAGGYKKGLCCGMRMPLGPAHRTKEELLEMSWEDWNESINKLDTRTETAAGKRGKDVDRCSETGAEYIRCQQAV